MARRVTLTRAAGAAAAAAAGRGSRIPGYSSVGRHGLRQRFGAATTTQEVLGSSVSSGVPPTQVISSPNARCLWVPSTSTVDWGGGDVTTSKITSANWVRHQSSSVSVDYSTLVAGPGTPLHNDIMQSASRNQTGYVCHCILTLLVCIAVYFQYIFTKPCHLSQTGNAASSQLATMINPSANILQHLCMH